MLVKIHTVGLHFLGQTKHSDGIDREHHQEAAADADRWKQLVSRSTRPVDDAAE